MHQMEISFQKGKSAKKKKKKKKKKDAIITSIITVI